MKITTLQLTDSEKLVLEHGYQMGKSHSYRIRCKAVMLKSQGKAAIEITDFLNVSVPSVFNWLNRYKDEGIKGLETKPGRGRKPIMTVQTRRSSAKPLKRIGKASARQGRHGRMLQAKRQAMLL